jgi:hypothetical protein
MSSLTFQLAGLKLYEGLQLIFNHILPYICNQPAMYLYLFQLAIICMSFAEYAVEAFASECEPNPFIVQLSAATTGEP